MATRAGVRVSVLNRIDRAANRLSESRPAVIALALATIAVIAVIDHITGTELSIVPIYLIPVAVAAWYIGRGAGRVMALLAGTAQLLADVGGNANAASWATILWNGVMIILLSWVMGEVLTRLHTALDSEHELARTDTLTGLPNTRSFSEMAMIEIDRSGRYHRAFTVASLDLDNFKAVNDTLGHAAGDRLLRDVARTLRTNLRRVDVVARVGGDEFTLMLPETNEEQAGIAMSHVRVALRALTDQYGPDVHASIGTVTFATPPKTVADMLRLADVAMYRAKAAGRDRVVSVTIPEGASDFDGLDLGGLGQR